MTILITLAWLIGLPLLALEAAGAVVIVLGIRQADRRGTDE